MQRFEDLVTEARALWPMVVQALPRDGAGPSDNSGDKRSATKVEAPPVVNMQALDAVTTIERQARTRNDEIRRLLGLPSRQFDFPEFLRYLPARNLDLAERPACQPLAADLARDLAGWVRTMRRVVGLDLAPAGFGAQCPRCHGAELRTAGTVGRLHPSILTGHTTPRMLARNGLPAITWTDPQRVYCPACRAAWQGDDGRRTLRGELRDSDRATAPTVLDGGALEVAHGVPSATLRQWFRRGRLSDCGTDARGRRLYRVDEVTALLP